MKKLLLFCSISIFTIAASALHGSVIPDVSSIKHIFAAAKKFSALNRA